MLRSVAGSLSALSIVLKFCHGEGSGARVGIRTLGKGEARESVESEEVSEQTLPT